MNKKQLRILKDNFNIYKDNNNWDLEAWTNGGVDMFITINTDKDIVEEFEHYLDSFDIDEEIEIHRENKDYKSAFKITESVKDFENWVNFVKTIKNILELVK